MIRSLIIIWLLLSILGYGMAVAADFHGGDVQADHIHAPCDGDGAPDAADGNLAHGHCCHGAFHLLGLNFTPAGLEIRPFLILREDGPNRWSSFFRSPPSRPPIA